jgi:hypothetical protein
MHVSTHPVTPMLRKIISEHKVLWMGVALAVVLSMIGSKWGVVEDWNPDQVALRSVPNNLMVSDYLKPPLNTYMHRLFVVNPVDMVMKGVLHCKERPWLEMRVTGVRVFTTLHFCAAVMILYFCVCWCVGKIEASVLALLMATSAGLLSYNHYGTADSPLLFWMMASFAFSLIAPSSDKRVISIAAGLLAGLAAACKYNGLGVAVAIPAAFFVIKGVRALRHPNLWIAGVAVPVGFVMGAPGAIFDTRRFTQDFLYNLYTTPVYAGDVTHAGYWKFLQRFPELIGLPCSILMAGCCLLSLVLCLTRKLSTKETLLLTCSAAVFAFYFITIGRFPRMETRFVLPAVPFIFLIAAPAISRIRGRILVAVIGVLLAYNFTCAIIVGLRYKADPRMGACVWAESNFRSGDLVESSMSPAWGKLVPGVKTVDLPLVTGRSDRFKKLLGNNEAVEAGIRRFDSDAGLEIFTPQALLERNPKYVTFCSLAMYFSGKKEARQYYEDHMAEKYGYHKVYEAVPLTPPAWAYPVKLDFIPDRMLILKKNGSN